MIDLLYIVQVNVFLALSGLGVYIATKSQSYHNTNRALIMATILLAFLAPTFDFVIHTKQVFSGILSPFEIKGNSNDPGTATQVSLIDFLTIFYLVGVAISLLIFIRNFIGIVKITGLNKLFKSNVIVSESVKTSSSFFRTVFLQPSVQKEDRNLIEQHEFVHTQELHSLDILLTQFAKALCWFNPVIYLLENQLKATHEFRADEVVAERTDSTHYSYLLISQSVGVDSNVLMHPFSQKNLLKQRINMLNNKPRLIMKYLFIVPALAAALFIVSCTRDNPAHSSAAVNANQALKVQNQNEITPDVKPIFAKGEQSLVDFMSAEIKYPKACEAENIEGTVVVNFIVDKQGIAGNFKVLKSPDERLSMAALDVMAKMPEWTPAQLEGKPVNMELTLPIKYALN